MTPIQSRRGYSYRPIAADLQCLDKVIAARFKLTGNSMTRPEAIRFCLQTVAGSSDPQAGGEAVNVPFLTIPLYGIHGTGKHMLVDESDWLAGVASGWPEKFIVTRNFNSGRFYVTTSKQPFSPNGQPYPLARLITGALHREVVAFKGENTLDLRRYNLVRHARSDSAGAARQDLQPRHPAPRVR